MTMMAIPSRQSFGQNATPSPVRDEVMRKIDECGMEKFGTLDTSEKTIAIS